MPEPHDIRSEQWHRLGPAMTRDGLSQLRTSFDTELAPGTDFQREYQEYEAKQIAARVPIDNPWIYREFDMGRKPIASQPGQEEWFYRVPRAKLREHVERRAKAWAIFGAGLAAMAAAILSLRRA